jgi:hypothetical protein
MNPLALLLVVVAVVLPLYFAHRRREKEIQTAFDLQNRLLDKFGSSSELLAYLESEPGRRLAQVPGSGPRHIYLRILSAIQAGVVLIVVSSTILLAKRFAENSHDQHRMAFISTVGLGLGAGFLASAGVTYIMARVWRLLKEDSPLPNVSE